MGSRLRRVQSLLNDGSSEKKDAPDALLCIAGIDSRYNDGSMELINYLLFGFFELRKSEFEGSGFEEEVIDDVLLCIQYDHVDVYCNPVNYHYLLPYVSHWRNVAFHCLTDEEYGDEEKAEDFKISSFVSMVKNHKKIGIPYCNSNRLHKFDPMLIEKWPIIQVYGVEEVGGGGFFTMQHEVVDVSSSVHRLYSWMDPVALETLVIEQVSKLERQWQTMLSTVEICVGSGNSSGLTEEKIFEPLRSFYVHGQANMAGGDQPSSNTPYVLFGRNTHSDLLDQASSKIMKPTGSFNTTTVGKDACNFMVCKVVSPRSPLVCSRTYFMHRQFVDPFQEHKITEYAENKDMRLLAVLYGAMVDAVLTGIQAYSSTLSCKQAEEVALETFEETCRSAKDCVVDTFKQSSSKTFFTMCATDMNCRQQPLLEGERSLLVKMASIVISDVHSVSQPGHILGSLVFSESFVDSEIRVLQTDGSCRLDGSFLLLTDHIPRYRSWACTSLPDDRKCLQDKLEGPSLHENFGSLLLSGDTVHLGCGRTFCLPPEEAILYAFENGLVIICPQYGAIILHGNHIRTAEFYDGDSSNTVALLVLQYQSTFIPFLPFHLHNEDCQLILMFTPKSKAYKHLFSEVLHKWRADSDSPKVRRVDTMPENCSLLHGLLQHQYSLGTGTKVKTALQKAAAPLPHLNSFLEHLAVSSIGWESIPESDIAMVLGQGTSTETETDIEIVVTILSGVPGSHQQNMCDVLTSLSKEQNRYVVLKPSVDSSQQFQPLDIQAKLKATLNVHRRRKQAQMALKNTRVLYIVPGYTDIVAVVQAIECHPDAEVRAHCAIGSITVCVDPLNVFMEHCRTLPYLLNMCAQGWVNQIVMTSSTELKNEDLETIQHLLRSVNSDVAFLLAEQGNVSRSMDLEAILSEDSFTQAGKVRARYLSCPDWRSTLVPASPSLLIMRTVQLNFSLPLDRQKLINRLRGLKAQLVGPPFTGNVYNVHGKIKLTDSKASECVELRYTTLSGRLVLFPYTESAKEKSQSPGNVVVFTGCQLSQRNLKDWLRECAPPKPEKKVLISRKDVRQDVIKKIHKDHHLDPLPEGWFYNGTQFISFDGTKQDQHPALEDFITAYIGEKNSEIHTHNAKVEELLASYSDLF